MSSSGMYRTVLPWASQAVSVRLAMNLCICPENSFLIVSGHDWSERHSGTNTPDMTRRREPTAEPRATPYWRVSLMFSAVTVSPLALMK